MLTNGMGTRAISFLSVSVLVLCVAASKLAADDRLPTLNDIEQKLSQHTERLGHMLAFKDSISERMATVTGYPLPVAWKIVCGLDGLRIVFGPPDAENATAVELADRQLTERQCEDLMPIVEGPVRRLTVDRPTIDLSASTAR